ncbi:MAG: NTP transferase domain-containing protein [Patescibacteria group bacterium]|nr:NTP transferase domain-containing protein [Patescibacteria group bacterium]
MQAVILAGGAGTRLRPLTNEVPKGMVCLNGRPLLEYVLLELPDQVSDIVIITGYKGNKIREYFGDVWQGHRIWYVEQKEHLGTWHAMYLAKDILTEKFIMLYGDDIGDKEAFTKGVGFDYCLFAAEREHPERYGVVELNADGTLLRLVEKPEHPRGNLVNSGAMILLPESFGRKPYKDERLHEYFLTDMLTDIAKEKTVQVIRQNKWITVTYPEDIPKAEALLKRN